MSRAEHRERYAREDPSQQNLKTQYAPARKLSLANISIPAILKRKPLPVNSPVLSARDSLTRNLNPLARQPRPSNLLTPIPSPGSIQLELRDLDRYDTRIHSAAGMTKRKHAGEYHLLILVRTVTLTAILPSQE